MRIDTGAEDLRAARGEVRVALAEFRNFRRADKREVHRPEKEHKPFPWIRCVGDFGKFLAWFDGDAGFEIKIRKLVSDCYHFLLQIDQ